MRVSGLEERRVAGASKQSSSRSMRATGRQTNITDWVPNLSGQLKKCSVSWPGHQSTCFFRTLTSIHSSKCMWVSGGTASSSVKASSGQSS